MKPNRLYTLLLLCCFFSCSDDKINSSTSPNLKQDIKEDNKANSKVPVFQKLDPTQTGINFINRIEATDELNIYTYEYFFNGGGVSVGDVNNDGLSDLYFSCNQCPNKLYINKGNFQFENITKSSGVEARGKFKTGTAMVDINNDGIINDEDQTSLGDPTPDFTYGINFSANYKNWDLGAFFNGVQGNEIYNVTKFFGYFFLDDNKLGIVRDAYTPANPNTNLPRVTTQDTAGNQLPSDFFVEDGSFFRLKTLEIGYSFNDFIGKEWISNARVFANIQNVFTITNYSGYDPEIGSNNSGLGTNRGFFGFTPLTNADSVFDRGLDVRAQPRPRTFVIGIQMSF